MPFRIPFIDNFPVDVLVFQKRENGLMVVKDKARYIKKDGFTYYELKKAGTKFRPASFDNMVVMKNGKVLAVLYEYQRDMIVPVDVGDLELIHEIKEGKLQVDVYDRECNKCSKKFKEDHESAECDGKECGGGLIALEKPLTKPVIRKAVNLHAIEEDMSMWSQSFRREMDMRHNNTTFWEKYSALIMMGMVFIFFIIMTNFFMQSVTDNANSIVDAFSKAAIPPG